MQRLLGGEAGAVVAVVVLKGLSLVLQGVGGVQQLVAALLGGEEVRLHVHGGQLLLGDGGDRPQLQLPGHLRAQQHLQLGLVGAEIHPQGLQRAGKTGLPGLGLAELQGGDLPHLIAQLHLLHRAVRGLQLPLQGGLLQLHGGQGHIGGLAGHDDLVLQVLDVAQGVGVVFLHLAVLDGVELLPDRVVGLVHLLIGQGAALAHEDHVPLALGDLVELLAQVLLQVRVVDAVEHVHGLLQSQDLQVALPHAALHVLKGDAAHGVWHIAGVDELAGLRVRLRRWVRARRGVGVLFGVLRRFLPLRGLSGFRALPGLLRLGVRGAGLLGQGGHRAPGECECQHQGQGYPFLTHRVPPLWNLSRPGSRIE